MDGEGVYCTPLTLNLLQELLIPGYSPRFFSGGNFQRPAFQQMISDMENGGIGIIVTKDLSRLGRNQLHTGLYIEERFPMFGVRYIAINDNVDTDSSESNDLMPFKNLLNEWFIWKHRKPRTQRNPGRHRKHDDLPGYPRNHLLPL